MPPLTTPVLNLIIRFQGLCCFLRDQKPLGTTREVTAALIGGKGSGANAGIDLCPHGPALVFQASDFQSFDGPKEFFTVLDPTTASKRPALGVWLLDDKELTIVGAVPGNLTIDQTFSQTPDLDVLTGGNGAASRECVAPVPPPARLITARVILTSGTLGSTAVAGTTAGEQWVFADADTTPTSGDPELFTQEVEYRFFGDPIPASVSIQARTMGTAGPVETLTLSTNRGPASVGISMLCPIDLTPLTKEADFVAYYHLLANQPAHQPIPQRLNPAPPPVRLGTPVCPPGTTFIQGGAI